MPHKIFDLLFKITFGNFIYHFVFVIPSYKESKINIKLRYKFSITYIEGKHFWQKKTYIV
jgi:hypothetical protein